MTRITLTLESDLAAALREAAQKDDRSMSSLARKALAEFIKSQPKQKGAKSR